MGCELVDLPADTFANSAAATDRVSLRARRRRVSRSVLREVPAGPIGPWTVRRVDLAHPTDYSGGQRNPCSAPRSLQVALIRGSGHRSRPAARRRSVKGRSRTARRLHIMRDSPAAPVVRAQRSDREAVEMRAATRVEPFRPASRWLWIEGSCADPSPAGGSGPGVVRSSRASTSPSGVAWTAPRVFVPPH